MFIMPKGDLERNRLRAFVRGQEGFKAWRATNGSFASRDFTNPLLEKAIRDLSLEAACVAMLASPVDVAETLYDPADMVSEFDGTNEERDAEMETGLAGPAGTGMASPDRSGMVASVIDQLRPFLAGTLLASVESALAPIVDAALKPAVIVEIEKTITLSQTVDASGNPVAPAFNAAKRVGASTVAKLFGLPARGIASKIHMSVWDSMDVPAVDPFYVADPVLLSKLVSAIDPALPRKPRYVWLAGPAGTGKTTAPQQIAARAGRPFVRIAFQRAVEPVDLIGMRGLDGKGGMVWMDGILTRAIRRPGTVILLDEITFAPAGLAAILQTLLDTRCLFVQATGETVECADGVTFVVADNTRGYGDETGLYSGTQQANAALVDRMARLLVVDYLEPELEAQALANHTGAKPEACKRVVEFIGTARKLAGFEGRPVSLRRQVAFVEMTLDGYSPDEAFDDTVLSRLPDAERETMRQHWRAAFDKAAYTAELKGLAAPQPVSSDPAQAVARGIFPVVE